MTQQIKVGDIVMLKSGGPQMTVSSVEPAYDGGPIHAWCDWFVQDRGPWKKDRGDFPVTSLVLV
ncbi:DUF2158 domain-containing protein [Sinorhizobium americanum]|uniref:DUF2158 domain-containing protein n=1 Tax=Sinorhizobium americanum TaxID=194963 RepID=UPI000BE945D2|nr:DUF2158 domain-containing protein [Sinorhizobium sp. FG01]